MWISTKGRTSKLLLMSSYPVELPPHALHQRYLSAAPLADELTVSDIYNTTAPEISGSTGHPLSNQIEQEQRLYSEASLQAHLKIIDREGYSADPKFPAAKKRDNKSTQRGPAPPFIDNPGLIEKKARTNRNAIVSKISAEEVHYNFRKFNEAEIDVRREILFDPSILTLTTDGLDTYLRQRLSRPARNKIKISIFSASEMAARGAIMVYIWGSGLTYVQGNPNTKLSWTIGEFGPGKQFFGVDPDELQTLLDRLCYILERLEPIVFQTFYSRARFLHSIFNRLIRYANPAFKLKAVVSEDHFPQLKHGSVEVQVPLHNMDLQSSPVYVRRFTLCIRLSQITQQPIKIPFEDRYMKIQLDCREQTKDSAIDLGIRVASAKRSSALQRLLYDMNNSDRKPLLEKSQVLARRLMYSLDGFVGSASHL